MFIGFQFKRFSLRRSDMSIPGLQRHGAPTERGSLQVTAINMLLLRSKNKAIATRNRQLAIGNVFIRI